MSESNGHSNGKPRPRPRELWMQAHGDQDVYRALMTEHGWLEYDANEQRFSRVALCTKTAWCTEPQGHEGGCIILNESRANAPGAVVDATNSKNPNGAQ